MRKPLLLLFAALLLCPGAARASGGNNPFENKGIELAADIISNPAAFFFDFQQDQESTNPLPPTKNFGVNWHFGQFIPIIPPYLIIPIPDPTIPNLEGKVKVFRENGLFPGMPQLDLIGGFWDAGPLLQPATKSNAESCTQSDCSDRTDLTPAQQKAVSTSIKKAKFGGNYVGAVLTSSLEPRVRLFWGYKQSAMKAQLDMNKPVKVMGSQVKSFDAEYKDKFLFAGIEHPTSPKTFWLMSMSYGIDQKSIMARVSWYRKYMELALDVYPEGVLVLHPSLNFHVNF